MDWRVKVTMTIDYLFGRGVGGVLPLDELEFAFSSRTSRLKRISLHGRHVATLRSDGGIALSPYGAQLLSKHPRFKENCVVVSDEARDSVSEGMSVFAKHVVNCGDRIRPGADVAVLDSEGEVIAVGKAILSAKMIKEFKTGVAVRVRKGVKS